MRRLLPVVTAVLVMAPAVARPCSLIGLPNGEERLTPGQTIPSLLVDGGVDTVAPVKPVLSNQKLFLFTNPCDGRGAACPQLDSLQVTLSTGDDQTAVEAMRYVAFTGATAAEVTAQTDPDLLFVADFNNQTRFGAWLGVNRARGTAGFNRKELCFAIAAVDAAANLSERSEVLCLDTTDAAAAHAVITEGAPCTLGCAGCSGVGEGPLALLGLVLLARRRRSRV